MRKSIFTLMFAFLAFAVMTSCNPKVEVSKPTEVEVAPEAPVADPAVVEGVESSTDGTAVQ
jgi:hypothetical protein